MSISLRVRERIEAIGTNPAELARRAGLARTFVSDLLLGKKKSVRGESLMVLASALDCDPEYLTGRQPSPRRARSEAGHVSIPVVGVCETGVWRAPGAIPSLGSFPISPDPRFPLGQQVAFFVRGNGGAKIGIGDGEVVCGVKPPENGAIPPEFAGAPVVVRQKRKGGESEISIRMIEVSIRGAVLSAPSDPAVPPIRFPAHPGEPEPEVLAIVTHAVRVFGARG